MIKKLTKYISITTLGIIGVMMGFLTKEKNSDQPDSLLADSFFTKVYADAPGCGEFACDGCGGCSGSSCSGCCSGSGASAGGS